GRGLSARLSRRVRALLAARADARRVVVPATLSAPSSAHARLRPMLSTARLVLRPWTTDDRGDARALWGSAEVMALLGGAMSDERADARLHSEIAAQEKDGLSYWRVSDGTSF